MSSTGKLNCEEYLYSPSEFQCVLDKPSEVAHYNMERLKSQICDNKSGICSEGSRGRPVKISKILPVEPKRYLEIMDISLGKSRNPYTMYIYGPELEVTYRGHTGTHA